MSEPNIRYLSSYILIMSVIMELQAIRRSNVLGYLQHNAAVMSAVANQKSVMFTKKPMRGKDCLLQSAESVY